MIEPIAQPTITYAPPQFDTEQPRHLNESSSIYLIQPKPTFNYAGLSKILAAQNASVDLSLNDLLELQDIDGAVTGGWTRSVPQRVNWMQTLVGRLSKVEPAQAAPLRRVSLAEARRSAIKALEEAEARRQNEREREAAFWAALEDEA
jgi:hypothetical protein